MRQIPLLATVLIAVTLRPIPVTAEPAIRYAKDFYNPDSPTCGIQKAIDSLPKEGGRVILEPRTYVLRAAVVLRDDLTLSGQGKLTVLTRGAEVIHKLTAGGSPGQSTVALGSAKGLRIGDEVAIRDDQFNGWHTTHGIIQEINGNSIVIDDRLVQPYSVERNALVINHHPMIEAYRIWDYRYRVVQFVVEDITIDGWECAGER